MGKINGIENYSEQYKEYGDKVLENAKTTLNKIGIEVFPQKSEENSNTNSCVIIKKKKSEPKETKKNEKKKNTKKNDIEWIRESLPKSNDVMSISSKIKNYSANALGNVTLKEQQYLEDHNNNNALDDDNEEEHYDSFDIFDAEDDLSNIDKIANASDDEGNGVPLLTMFEKEKEKDINDGFSSNNFIGTNYEKEISAGSSNENVTMYSDNLYHNKNTLVIFGGTANVTFSQEKDDDDEEDNNKVVDFNAYAYGKLKTQKITYGAGVMDARKDNVNDLNISIGAMHNETGIYGIIQKNITMIPGQPNHSETNINIGIGQSSGLLNPDDYNKKDPSIEEIGDIDDKAQTVEDKESKTYEINLDEAGEPSSTIANLIIKDTNNDKEYGIKGGYIFRHTTKKQNYSFIMPYGQISNVTVDSKEGLKMIAGVNLGQDAKIGQGWELKTKGVVELSRDAITGSRPSDYILANVNFKANKKNFDGEISVGGFYTSEKTFCKYMEAKIKYNFNENLSVDLKSGYADSKFDTDSNRMYQIAAGVHYKF